MSDSNRWIEQHLKRLAFGQFLHSAAEWLAGFLFVFGTAVLVVKLFVPELWPNVLWLGLGAIPVTVIAWRFSLQGRYTPIESAALLDRKLNAGGLLMTLAETPDELWQERLPQLEQQWSESIPKVRPVRFAKFLALPLLFAVAAGLAPLRKSAALSSPPTIRQQVSRQLQEMLDVLEDADALQKEEKEELREEIEKLAEEAQHKPLTHEKWETVDALRERLKMRLDTASQTVSKAQHAAGMLADAGRDHGQKLSIERSQRLEQDLQDALKKLAQNGAFSKSGTAQQSNSKLFQNGRLNLSQNPGERKEQLKRLGEFLKQESDKLAQCRKCFGEGKGLGTGGFNTSDTETDSNRPGRGGINRGRGDAELTWGKESDQRNTKFKEVVLPPGFLDDPNQESLGTTAVAPEVQPADSAPRNTNRLIDPASGKATWNRTLRPRHRGVVKKYFDSKQND
ncbi:MAG: hypothetical protein IH899_18530 [Planctomycetes bacterium]|nr:hypothetical protein [Planctomycetota bacterium]